MCPKAAALRIHIKMRRSFRSAAHFEYLPLKGVKQAYFITASLWIQYCLNRKFT